MSYAPTYSARPATPEELDLFRSDGNSSRLYAIFDVPVLVFTAQINQAFSTVDMITKFSYDNPTLLYTNCKFGMTVVISTSLPATRENTVGLTHVRRPFSAVMAYVGESSNVPYADNLFMTVLDEYGPWQDHVKLNSSGSVFVRSDVPYSDQHTNFDPTPIIGSDQVIRLDSSWVVDFDGAIWTAFGDAHRDETYAREGSASMALSSGVNGLNIINSKFVLGYSPYTFEAWVRLTPGTYSYNRVVVDTCSPAGGGYRIVFFIQPDNHLNIFGQSAYGSPSVASLSDDVWHHVALVKSDSTHLDYYIDGVKDSAVNVYLASFPITSGGCTIGKWTDTFNSLAGNIDQVRISNVARWSSDFKPSYQPYLPDVNTVSLMTFDSDKPLSKTLSFVASSYMIDGTAIASQMWSFPGSDSTTGLTTGTPTATYSKPGRYTVNYQVVSSAGKAREAHRNVYLYNALNLISIDVKLDGFSWDLDSGGSEFSMTVVQDANTTQARDRTKVVLFEEAFYAGLEHGSIGPLLGSENIVGLGWLDDESVPVDWLRGSINFTVKSAHYWLDKETAFTVGYISVTGTPHTWVQMKNLNCDLAMWDALAWRSTLLGCVDVQFTGDTRKAVFLKAPQGSLWKQLNSLAHDTILAKPCCDNYSRLFIEVETALTTASERSSYPTILTLTTDDYENLDTQRITVNKTGRVDLSGVIVTGTTGKAVFSLASGHVFDRYGEVVQVDQLLLASQGQSNQLAADVKAQLDKDHTVTVNGAANNRLVGVCPHQFIHIDIPASDSVRGIGYNENLIVRRVDWSHEPSGKWVTNWVCDPETQGSISANGDVPLITNPTVTSDPGVRITFPTIPPVISSYPSRPPDPPKIPAPPGSCLDASDPSGPYSLSASRPWIDGSDNAEFRHAYLWIPCTIRSSSAANPTVLEFDINNKGLAYSHLHVYGIDGGYSQLIAGSITISSGPYPDSYHIHVEFSSSIPINVWGFEISCDQGLDAIPVPITDPGPAGGNGLIADVWGYFSSMTALSDRTAYDPAGGYTKYMFSGVNDCPPGTFFGNLNGWYAKVNVTSDVGALGLTSVRFQLDGVIDADKVTVEFSTIYGPKHIPVNDFFTLSPDEGPVFNPIGIHIKCNDGWTASIFGSLELWYTATLPARSAAFSSILLYNVCPPL